MEAEIWVHGAIDGNFYLIIPTEKSPVPEPATMLLLGSGLSDWLDLGGRSSLKNRSD